MPHAKRLHTLTPQSRRSEVWWRPTFKASCGVSESEEGLVLRGVAKSDTMSVLKACETRDKGELRLFKLEYDLKTHISLEDSAKTPRG